MQQDRSVGSTKQLDRRIRAAIGQAIGDAELRAAGLARQAEGRAQRAARAAKDAHGSALKP